jgi:hypothetical protein
MNFENDIPLDAAVAAHAGTSWSPEDRGAYERRSYAASLQQDLELFQRYADTDEKKALLEVEFARYREGFRRRYMAYLASRSRVVSAFIAGPSNFPVRRMEKRAAVNDRRLQELLDFQKRARAAIIGKLNPDTTTIRSGDEDAVDRLKEKIANLEKQQQIMKDVNAAIRKAAKHGKDAQVAAVVNLGLSVAQAKQLIEPDFCGRIGFADYETKNNGANIRRLKERLEAVSRAKATPDTDKEGTNARIEDRPAENRVRLFFPGKPAPEVIQQLKAGGWRWTPSLGCWQAYRNNWSLTLADKLAGIPSEKKEETA